MSGSGRKSAYRKGVTKKVLYDDPEPKENEQIVRVVALRGNNLFEIKQADGTLSLTMLPTRFRKLIWVKRGDYLIVSGGDGDITTSEGKKGAVTSMVESVLYKDQIKSLRAKGLWPDILDDVKEEVVAAEEEEVEEEQDAEEEEEEVLGTNQKNAGIQMVSADAYFVNRNRRRGVIEDEEEEEEEDDERIELLAPLDLLSVFITTGRNMQRRSKGAAYEVTGAPASNLKTIYGAAESSSSRPRLMKQTEFIDLRVDAYDRCASKSILGVTKAPLLPSKSKAPSGVAYQPSLALMMPSATPNGLKRCQSASMIRKKLQHAMEQSAQSTPEQIAALRSLSATAITAKPTPKTLLNSRSQTSVFTPQHQPDSNQHRSQADSTTKPKFSTMFAEPSPHTSTSSVKRPNSASASAGSFKSNCIQLEVELAERLNEIERSKLSEKAESRFRACQRAFDHIIHQDEPFGRILANIRDEYDAYIAFLTQHNRLPRSSSGNFDDAQCNRTQQQTNQARDKGFDMAQVRQENSALKRNCASMQRELEVLQASILATAIHHSTKTQPNKHVLEPEDDSLDEEEELSDVLLLPLEEATKEPLRPITVPQLDFSCLSPYNEEEEEFEEDNEEY